MLLSESQIVHPSPTTPKPLVRVFALEALGAVGGSLLMLGIFFYMQKQFAFGARKNLLLSTAQGAVYVIGALGANSISKRIGKRMLLRLLNGAMLFVSAVGFFGTTPFCIVVALLAYTALSAAQWPLLESLISGGANPSQLSRLISIYNLVWSGSGALMFAFCGAIIVHYPPGIFLVAIVSHLLSLLLLLKRENDPESHPPVHYEPEAELIPMRQTAMRLSRVVLPATFAVLYGLGAMMPTLPVIRATTPQTRTMLASVWMIARWGSFILLGTTTWWHTRPRAMLIAALGLLVSFLGITLSSSVHAMILFQIVLGVSMGLIYSGSLYFGMVLSDGSAEHGGYHEALIGLGSILGPGAGFIAQTLRPGDQNASIVAVSVVLGISIMLSAGVSLGSRPKIRNQSKQIA